MVAAVFMTLNFLLQQPSLLNASVPFVTLQLALSFRKIIASVFPPPSNPHMQIGTPLAYLSSNIYSLKSIFLSCITLTFLLPTIQSIF
jgi:hypothetical protein